MAAEIVSEVHRLQWQLLIEQIQKAQTMLEVHRLNIKLAYKLGEKDSIDMGTGQINRTPEPAPEPAPAKKAEKK